jgi:hypothetical protein
MSSVSATISTCDRGAAAARPGSAASSTDTGGPITAGGVSRDVTFEEARDLDAEVDAAYRAKYRRYEARVVEPMVAPQAQAATLKLVPA